MYSGGCQWVAGAMEAGRSVMNGGGESTWGGASTLDTLVEDYNNSGASKAKRELIRKLADSIFKALKVDPSSPDDDLDSVITKLDKVVPNPRRGKSIIADKEKQERLCRDVAEAINSTGYHKINTDTGASAICDQISDMMDSLTVGLHREFVVASSSIESGLNNLMDLKKLIEASFNKITDEASQSDDIALKAKMPMMQRAHNNIMSEFKRQVDLLANITTTNLKSEDRKVLDILRNNTSFKKLVQEMTGYDQSSRAMGERISYFLSNVSNTAQMAGQVEASLKEIGMPISEYKKINKWSDFLVKAQELLDNIPKNNLTRDYIVKYEKAMATLKGLHGMHAKVGPLLGNSVSGGGNVSMGGSLSSSRFGRQMTNRGEASNMVTSDFKAKADVYLDRLYVAIFKVAKEIGSGKIPLSDDLYRFKMLINDMKQMFYKGFEYVLTGVKRGSVDIEYRERFLGLLRALVQTSEPLKGSSSEFSGILDNISGFLKLVDSFSDKFTILQSNVLGRGECHECGKSPCRCHHGGADGGREFGAAVTFGNAINSLNHFYNIAKFRINLRTASAQNREYDKGYTELVGTAVGARRTELSNEYDKALKELGEKNEGADTKYFAATKFLQGAGGIGHAITHTSTAIGGEGVPPAEYSAEDIKELMKAHYEARDGLYKVAEAVDKYLQLFTDEVSASPDDIVEVSKLLSSMELMSEWFEDKSGDAVAGLFEIFPWTMVGFRTFYNPKLQTNIFGKVPDVTNPRGLAVKKINHYYDVIGKSLAWRNDNTGGTRHTLLGNPANSATVNAQLWNMNDHNAVPGNPFIGISPKRALLAQEFAKYTMDKIHVLKNIVSAFGYLGDKVNGKSISRSVEIMSPNDIYVRLNRYMYVSAFSIGWNLSVQGIVPYGLTTGIATINAAFTGNELVRENGAKAAAHADLQIHNSTFGHDARGALHGGFNNALSQFQIAPMFSQTLITAVETGNAVNQQSFNSAGNVINSGNTDTDGCIVHPDKTSAQIGTDPVFSGRYLKSKYAVTMSAICHTVKTAPTMVGKQTTSGWAPEFDVEDELFVNIIKAMIGKVFTVSGLYNMLNYYDKKHHSMMPTRMVLGGGKRKGGFDNAVFQMPKIHQEATELYLRLPLLAEFYREIFYDHEQATDANRLNKIMVMIPEASSMWASFLKTMWAQPQSVNGMYSDNVVRQIVHAVNEVYATMKGRGAKNIVSETVSEFVAEVNMRYGIITRSDLDTWKKQNVRQKGTREDYDAETSIRNYDILDEDYMGTGVTPSDAYGSRPGRSAISPDDKIDDGAVRALRDLHKKIDEKINAVAMEDSANFYKGTGQTPDFGNLITLSQQGLSASTDDNERFEIVKRMLTGANVSTRGSAEVSVMFHEMILAPMVMLNGVRSILEAYIKQINKYDGYKLWKALVALFKSDNTYMTVAAPIGGAGAPHDAEHLHKRQVNLGVAGDSNVQDLVTDLYRDNDEFLATDFMGLAAASDFVTMVNLVDTAALTDATYRGNGWHSNADPARGIKQMDDDTFSVGRQMAYVGIRWELILQKMVGALYGISAAVGDMVEVSVQNEKVTINHTKLQALCESVFSSIRTNLETFRGTIPSDIINTYSGDSTRVGSVEYLQRTLMDEIFSEIVESGVQTLSAANLIATRNFQLISGVNPDEPHRRAIYYGLDAFTGAYNVAAGGAAAGGGGATRRANGKDAGYRSEGWCVNSVISSLVYYDSQTMHTHSKAPTCPFMAAPATAAPTISPYNNDARLNFASPYSLIAILSGEDPCGYLLKSPDKDAERASGDGRSWKNSTQYMARYDFYLQDGADFSKDRGFRGDTCGEKRTQLLDTGAIDAATQLVAAPAANQQIHKTDTGMGLMMKFNEVMAAYLRQFWDNSANKLYAPLIETPSNGVFNQEVFRSRGWDDTIQLHADNMKELRLKCETGITTARTTAIGADPAFQAKVTDVFAGRLFSDATLFSTTYDNSDRSANDLGLLHHFLMAHYQLNRVDNVMIEFRPEVLKFGNDLATDILAKWSQLAPDQLTTQLSDGVTAIARIKKNAAVATLNAVCDADVLTNNVDTRSYYIKCSDMTAPDNTITLDTFEMGANNGDRTDYLHFNEFVMIVGSYLKKTVATIIKNGLSTTAIFDINNYRAQMFSDSAALRGDLLRWLTESRNFTIANARRARLVYDAAVDAMIALANADTVTNHFVATNMHAYINVINIATGRTLADALTDSRGALTASAEMAAILTRNADLSANVADSVRNALRALRGGLSNGAAVRVAATIGGSTAVIDAIRAASDARFVAAQNAARIPGGASQAARVNGIDAQCMLVYELAHAENKLLLADITAAIGMGQALAANNAAIAGALAAIAAAVDPILNDDTIKARITPLANVDRAIISAYTPSVREYDSRTNLCVTEYKRTVPANAYNVGILNAAKAAANVYFSDARGNDPIENRYKGLLDWVRDNVVQKLMLTGIACLVKLHSLGHSNTVTIATACMLAAMPNESAFTTLMTKIFVNSFANAQPLGITATSMVGMWIREDSTIGNVNRVYGMVKRSVVQADAATTNRLMQYGLSNGSNGGFLSWSYRNTAPFENADRNIDIQSAIYRIFLGEVKTLSEGGILDVMALVKHSEKARHDMRLIGGYGDPVEILFATTSRILKTALTETGKANSKTNVIQSMAEVPLRMKELYKSQLPIFKELFQMISKKAAFLRNMIRISGMGLDRVADDAIVPKAKVVGFCEAMLPVSQDNANTRRVYLSGLLDKITSACSSMVSTISAVQNELNDSPLYLELNENSINEYRSTNGRLPFMPLSTTTIILQRPALGGARVPKDRDPQLCYPVESVGTDLFKFNYGTRQLLHGHDSNPMLEQMPGMMEILLKYNSAVTESKRLVQATYGTEVSKLVLLMRYLTGTRIYSPLFGGSREIVDISIRIDRSNADSTMDKERVFVTKQMDIVLADTIGMTASSKGTDDNSQKITDLVYISTSNPAERSSRGDMATYNIIDMNISPVNFNAMRREIPLVNIYNYAYTFDSVISDVVQGIGNEDSLGADSTAAADTRYTHEVLAALCKHPYHPIGELVYHKTIANIAHGSSSIDLYGRPKFISDQLWQKALFGSAQSGGAVASVARHDGHPNFVYDSGPVNYAIANRGQIEVKLLIPTSTVTGKKQFGSHLKALGRLRFDTKFIRNLFFLTNAHRIMLHKINKEISQIRLPVVSDFSAVSDEITGYADEDVYVKLE